MKILFLPQYSMRSYKTGKWLIHKDSHFDFFTTFAKAMQSIRKDLQFHFIVPEKADLALYGEVLDINGVNPKRVFFHAKPFAPNVLSERVNFDYDYFYQLIKHNDIDIVLNNNESFSKGFDTIRLMGKMKFKLYTLFSHIPFYRHSYMDKRSTSFYRMQEAAACSDGLFTLLEDVQPTLQYFLDKEVNLLPFCEESLLSSEKQKEDACFLAIRLSDTNKFNIEYFNKIVERCNKRHLNLHVANPNEIDAPVEIEKYLVEIKSKQEYYDMLRVSKYCPMMLNPSLTFSTIYTQALRSLCETNLYNDWNEHQLMMKADEWLSKYSIERNMDSFGRLLKC
jgi:hypothetical protein